MPQQRIEPSERRSMRSRQAKRRRRKATSPKFPRSGAASRSWRHSKRGCGLMCPQRRRAAGFAMEGVRRGDGVPGCTSCRPAGSLTIYPDAPAGKPASLPTWLSKGSPCALFRQSTEPRRAKVSPVLRASTAQCMSPSLPSKRCLGASRRMRTNAESRHDAQSGDPRPDGDSW